MYLFTSFEKQKWPITNLWILHIHKPSQFFAITQNMSAVCVCVCEDLFETPTVKREKMGKNVNVNQNIERTQTECGREKFFI